MKPPALAESLDEEIDAPAADFYRRVLRCLSDAGIPFLVGGSFAHACHTGIRRPTKDLDLFILRQDYERIMQRMAAEGWDTEMRFPHWLAKVWGGQEFVDLIFNSGNGVIPVDARWFASNRRAEVLGVPVHIVNVEDSLLSKAFVMERERYDGGDIAHLLQVHAQSMEWNGLLERFGAHWRVLLAHLTLFGYIYPAERHHVPRWVMERLMDALADETREAPATQQNLCAGTLLSREQYLYDIRQLGYTDGRLTQSSTMTPRDVAIWTDAITSESGQDHPLRPPIR